LFLVKTPQTNVFRVKVLDFGIAKLTGPENKEMSVKTRTGSVLGTPSYMSPEQCRGHGKVDWRSDVYALGCIMYEMLVGHPPFQGSGYGEVLAQHIYEPPTPIRQLDPALPEGIETLIARMLQKNPEQRLQSMEEFATVLDSLSNIPALVSASGSGGARIETSGAFPMPSPQATPPPMPAPGPPSAALPVREPERTHTTLRGSAAEKVGGRPGKRGLGIPLAIGGALVLVIGTVAVAMRGGASADQPVVTPTARPAEPVAPPPIAQEPVKPPVAAAPIAVATAPSVPEPPVAAANPPASEPKAPAASPDKKPEDIAVAKPEPTAPVPAPVALPIPTATATATAPAPAPAVVPPPVVPPPPAPVTFRVDSEPTGADVLRDGKPVGKTPLDTSLPPQSAKVAFVVALKGYKSSTVELPGDKGGDKKVVLVAEAAVSKPPEARAPEAKPSAIKPGAAPKKAKPVGDKTVNPFK
jgi:serine/threonine-protein kinase